MKTERRHELKENELKAWLLDSREFFRKNGKYLTWGAVGVIAVYAVANFAMSSREQAASDQWAELTKLQEGFKEDNLDQSKRTLDGLKGLAAGASDPQVVRQALMLRGRMADSLALKNPTQPDKTLLDQAKDSYTELLSRFGERSMLDAGTAVARLATIDANYFVVDASPAHKDAARKHWERLRDDPRFKGTPFQSEALAQLNVLDSIFQTVAMVEAPPPPIPPTGPPVTPTAGPTIQATTPDGQPLPIQATPISVDDSELPPELRNVAPPPEPDCPPAEPEQEQPEQTP